MTGKQIFFSILFFSALASAQKASSYIDVSYFTGNIARHNPDISHLIQAHPSGVIIGFNQKTSGTQPWEQGFNYPDYGYSLSFQDFNNPVLGKNIALYGHYNFYLLKRHILLRIGQGIAYNTNPYDKHTNFRNVAFGSSILSSTYAMLQYKKERIFDRFGLQLGLSLIHYSNANIKAPNTSLNSVTCNIGLTYNLSDTPITYTKIPNALLFKEKWRYNIAFRAGINESDIIHSGQYPFYIFSAYADKRINLKSALQGGVDVFFSTFLKEYARYRSIAFAGEGITGTEDYKRIGVFLGHELFLRKISVVSQLGYYVYAPIAFEGKVYIRAGLKRYFTDKIYGAITLKSHAAKAEAVEFGVGIRL